ncbi:MAG: ComEC/Rec2 family competence protein [Prosthecobacter sp.]
MPAKLQSWARANPLMVLALAAVAGILITDLAGPSGRSEWLIGGAGLLLAAALGLGRAWLLVPACALVFAFIHEARLRETFQHPLRQMLQNADKPVQAVIHGSLLPEYDMTADGRAHALCTTQKIEISATGLVIEQPAGLLLRLPKGVRFPGAGVFALHGRLYLPRASTNPGAFNAQEHALRLGRVARFDVDRLKRAGSNGQGPWCAFLEMAEHCRQWMSAKLTQDLEGDPETAAVIRAMALGVSAEADHDIEDAFRNSGTLHVFAVSGLHVGLLGLIVLKLLRAFGVSRGLSMGITIGLVFAYAFVTGWRPSAERSALMVAVLMGATLVDRESSLANSLGLAAVLILGWDTHHLFMPGFQLSFGVLWASSAGSEPLVKRLRPLTQLDPFLPPQLANWRQRGWSRARRWLVTTLSVSFAAWVGSLPFILGHFQAVTPVAVVANCVLVPLSTLCLTVTCMSLCAAIVPLFSGAHVLFNNLNWLFAKAMIVSAAWFAALPGGNFHFKPAPPATDAPAVWRILELSHGGAANHLSLGKEHWLFDTGDEDSFRHALRPCLHSSGVDSVSGVFLSHNDSSHIGAIAQVAATFDAPRLYCSTQEPGPQDTAQTTLRQFLDSSHGGMLRKLQVDERLTLSDDKGFKVEAQVLHPSRLVHSARGDDRAMVLMLHAGPWRVLWMSDAGWNAEKHLCASSADLRCDVLIRSQHEHDRTITTKFLLKAAPRAILCGSDPRNAETALPASLVEFARGKGIPLLDTWTDGSIELRLGDKQMELLSSRAREPVLLKKKERAK